MRLQVGKHDFVAVRFERILVRPYDVPFHFLVERSPGVAVDVEHVEHVHQVAGVGLEEQSALQ